MWHVLWLINGRGTFWYGIQGLSETLERANAVIEAIAVFVDTLLLLWGAHSSVTIPSPPGFEPGSNPFRHLEDEVRRQGWWGQC